LVEQALLTMRRVVRFQHRLAARKRACRSGSTIAARRLGSVMAGEGRRVPGSKPIAPRRVDNPARQALRKDQAR
jgi:hypothetical protein